MSTLNWLPDFNPVALLANKIFNSSNLLTNLSTYAKDLVLKDAPMPVEKGLFLIGVSAITFSVWKTLKSQYLIWNWLPSHIKNKHNFSEKKIKEKYGRGRVLITGGADGIGLAFAKKFASMGFNLIITDIDQKKLDRRKSQLEISYGIKVVVIALDMSSKGEMNILCHRLQNQIGDSISVVVNNVGMAAGGQYCTIDPKRMAKQIQLNYMPMYRINQVMLPKLRNLEDEEGPHGAIINLASATGIYLSPGIGAYAAVKAASDMYTVTMAMENKGKVDIISVRPFGVSTSMLNMMKKQRIITPRQCVEGVLYDLGNSPATFSGAPHKLMAGFFSSLTEKQRAQTYLDTFKKKYD